MSKSREVGVEASMDIWSKITIV